MDKGTNMVSATREGCYSHDDDVEHLPHYIQDIKAKVIYYKQPASEMPPANIVQSLAKKQTK